MLSWSDRSLPDIHIPKEITSFPPPAPSSAPSTWSGRDHTLGSLIRQAAFPHQHLGQSTTKTSVCPLPNEALSQTFESLCPPLSFRNTCRESSAVNKSIVGCAESWHEKASSVKPLGHHHRLQKNDLETWEGDYTQSRVLIRLGCVLLSFSKERRKH